MSERPDDDMHNTERLGQTDQEAREATSSSPTAQREAGCISASEKKRMIATEYHVQYARTERGKKAHDDARIRRQKEESLRRYLEKAILRCDDFLAIDYVEEIPQCDRDIEKLTVELNEHLA